MVSIDVSRFSSLMRSKKHLYEIMATESKFDWELIVVSIVRMYLPPYDECSLQFLTDIMQRKKKVGPLLIYTLITRSSSPTKCKW